MEPCPRATMPTDPEPTLPGDPDLDLAILRVMYPSGHIEPAGIDPRLNATRIARELRVGRGVIAQRLRAWSKFGFLAQYDVWPNPALFGQAPVWLDVRVADRLQKESVLERIGLVPGAVMALDVAGEWIAATFVRPVDEDRRRLADLVQNLSGVREVGPPSGGPVEAPDRLPTPLDFRIIRVLRRHPRESLANIARLARVSTRTITTRYHRLIENRAVWFVPIYDFRALAEPVLSVNVRCASGPDRERFAHSLHRAFPRILEFLRSPVSPMLTEDRLGCVLIARSAARVEGIERWIRAQPGVVDCELAVMVRQVVYPETFDRLIASMPAGSPTRS